MNTDYAQGVHDERKRVKDILLAIRCSLKDPTAAELEIINEMTEAI